YIESDSVESSPLDTISRENVFIREDDSLDVDTTGTQEEEKQPETPAYPEEEDDDDGDDDDDDEKFF
ncbi:MAG: hypothetical protein ACOCZI_01685, partial [Marinilabiliaceae bacterium]